MAYLNFLTSVFDLVGTDLIKSLNKAFEVGELSISQRRGVVTMIRKEDFDLLELQNYRLKNFTQHRL